MTDPLDRLKEEIEKESEYLRPDLTMVDSGRKLAFAWVLKKIEELRD